MAQLGDDELISIFKRINNPDDRRSFSQVSKQFLKLACSRLTNLHIAFPDLLYDILPESPNLVTFECHKPLSNTHMKLLAHSCPKLRYMNLSLEKNTDSQADSMIEVDFDNNGLCEVTNACKNLYYVSLSRRLHVGDVEVTSLVRSSKNLAVLDLSGCVSVTDESLKAIAETTSWLRVLNLQGCYLITDLGLKYLSNGHVRHFLEELVLAECDRISDDGILYLKQIRCLTDLNLSKCGVNITDVGVGALLQLPKIERLDLSWLINVTDISLFVIGEHYWKLRAISLTGCEAVTSEGLLAFEDHETLEELEFFSCHNFSWEDVVILASSCERLKYLGLTRRMVTPMPEAVHNDFYVINNCWIDWE
ncbi:uncharacterized protein LOC111877580 [Lactuca sativa]|uniref:uncharacterized protein LOC111877580 n=1 Tax=Lactuca sativa TaxID=4236 RepID=UPI000CB9051C|nr:uncharacterized protein LOC111877580 [Lactuca sativa]